MADDRYNIVFTGELVRSFELAVVKKNLSKLFKIDGAKLEALFSGNAVVLKKNVDFDAATKYRTAIKRAGARVDLQAVQLDQPSSPTSKAVSTQPQVETSKKALSPAIAKSNDQQVSEDSEYASGLHMAPPGSLVLNADEREIVAPTEIDVSSLSLRERRGNLLDADEIPTAKPADESTFELDLDSVGLAPAGEDLLRESERKKDEPLDLDLSELSLAEPGARLEKPAVEPPPAPDTSGLSLEP